MNIIEIGRKRLPWKTLCGACAIWATTSLAAHGGPPGRGAACFHSGINRGIYSNRGPYGGYGYNGSGNGWGVGVAGLYGVDLTGDENQIPYFAAHPPVYYSYPIARPYGDSPYPYPPGLFVPAASEGGPQMIINPFAQPGGTAPANAAPTSAAPATPTPAPPPPSNASPDKSAPSNVKPTAGRTASATPPAETLPSPEAPADPVATAPNESRLHVVLNPYAK